jgi:hypothetical protein
MSKEKRQELYYWRRNVVCKLFAIGTGVAQSDYGLSDQGSIPGRGKEFSSNLCVQTGSGAHPASCTVGTGASFPQGKVRPGRDADHSPPSNAEVKNE